MMIILISLLGIALSLFLAVLALNYSNFLYEQKRVNDLASRIKPAQSDILHRSDVSREFTSFDLRDLSKTAPAKAAQNIYSRTLVHLSSQEYPSWFARLVQEFEAARKNLWHSISRLIQYLLHLSKPATDEAHIAMRVRENEKQSEIADVVERVLENNRNDLVVVEERETEQEVEEAEGVSVNAPVKSKQKTATIGLAGSGNGDERDMNMFEKLENRILDKLKNSGLNNYDIWLELGELYVKYGEKEKATEVFALVLKHTFDERQKEMARNHLIGL